MRKEEHYYNKGYRITEDGEIINPKGKSLKGVVATVGYLTISGKINGEVKPCHVHRLQAYQKYKDKMYEDGIEVRHLNGNPLDNSCTNISIGTHSDNMQDIPKKIRMEKALRATSFVRKYDKDEVKQFHALNGNSYKATMREFNISSKGTLHFILTN